MRYYIPISDDDEYLCLEADKPARIVRGKPDPFSRVACPGILWDRVLEDLPYLTKAEIDTAKKSRIAYTRLHEE